MENGTSENPTPSRPRLNLKPRDPNAAARLEAERQQALAKSPFGAAKPRERVIAERAGKSEEDVLKEEVKKEKIQLRLNPAQLEEKRSHEEAVKEIQDQVDAEEDEAKKQVLLVELAARQAKLDSLTERFVKLTLETALSGEAPRVSQIRRQNAEAAQAQPQYLAQGHAPGQHYNQRYNPTQQYAGPPTRGGYQRAGFDHYQAGGRGGYQARGGPSRGGGGGGRNSVPEWAREEYAPPGIGGGGRGAGGFDQQGGYRGPTGAGYGDSDAGFYDQPVGQQPPSGYGGGGSRGRGRGRGRGRDSYNGAGGGGGGGGGYYDSFAGGYGAPPSGRGVGGEIEFDTFAGQDRY